MTQDSRAAFEAWYVKEYPEWLRTKEEFAVVEKMFKAWQASEQRIMDELGSEEMVEVVARRLCLDNNPDRVIVPTGASGQVIGMEGSYYLWERNKPHAKAAITAITNKIKGE